MRKLIAACSCTAPPILVDPVSLHNMPAGYTYATVRQALDADETLSISPHQVPLVARRLGDGPLATLIRLFVIGAPVTPDQGSRALAPLVAPPRPSLARTILSRSACRH